MSEEIDKDPEMVLVRKDILSDLYKAIDEVIEQIFLGEQIYFGNVMMLKDELESGKRYSDI